MKLPSDLVTWSMGCGPVIGTCDLWALVTVAGAGDSIDRNPGAGIFLKK